MKPNLLRHITEIVVVVIISSVVVFWVLSWAPPMIEPVAETPRRITMSEGEEIVPVKIAASTSWVTLDSEAGTGVANSLTIRAEPVWEDDRNRVICPPELICQYSLYGLDLSVLNSGMLIPAEFLNIKVPEGYTYIKIMPWKEGN